MIGALMMRKVLSKDQAATVNAKDIEALKKFWADDVTLTFVGQPSIEGKDAVEAWYRSWFAGIKEIRETSTNFALVHPYALGVTNTVLFETKSGSYGPVCCFRPVLAVRGEDCNSRHGASDAFRALAPSDGGRLRSAYSLWEFHAAGGFAADGVWLTAR